MRKEYFAIAILLSSIFWGCRSQQTITMSDDFAYIDEVIPHIVQDIKYYYDDNFMGCRVEGYFTPRAILSQKALIALKKVQTELAAKGLSLKIFDAYRPQSAVNHFIKWAKDRSDTIQKAKFYPQINKSELFKLGYISSKSGHTRGSTLDLTIVDVKTGIELDMGAPFDFFGHESHHNYNDISPLQKENRLFLKNLMIKYGFEAYPEEWWHYTLVDEPFPDTYFDFPVK